MAKDFEIVVTDGTKRFDEALEQVKLHLAHVRGGVGAAVSRSMNRAATACRASAVKTIREDFYAKANVIRKHFSIERASRENLEIVVSTKGSPLPADAFMVRPKRDTTGRNRKPVRIAIKRGTVPKPISRAFIHQGRVLRRESKTSRKVQGVYGPAVPHMADTPKVADRAMTALNETFLKRLDHEVKRVLDKGVENRGSKK